MLSVPSAPAPPAPPSSPPAPKPNPTPHGTVKVGFGSHLVKHGRVPLSLGCSGAACTGKVTLSAKGKELGLRGKKARRRAAIAGRSYRLAAGRSETIALKLNRRAVAVLRHHQLRVTAKVTVSGGNATTRTTRLRRG